jgi:Response regulator containing CheY-like receiver, AAA-type ATPase, and DNA-binding domains
MARILVVDDDVDFLTAVSIVLEDLDHAPVTARSAAEGLAMAVQDPPDIAFLDVIMPGGGAIILHHQIREACPDTRIVICTGKEYLADAPIMHAGLAGADARVSKSLDSTVLQSLIARLLSKDVQPG